jgi:hypothetical protein
MTTFLMTTMLLRPKGEQGQCFKGICFLRNALTLICKLKCILSYGSPGGMWNFLARGGGLSNMKCGWVHQQCLDFARPSLGPIGGEVVSMMLFPLRTETPHSRPFRYRWISKCPCLSHKNGQQIQPGEFSRRYRVGLASENGHFYCSYGGFLK